MKKLLIILCIGLASCTSDKKTEKILQNEGYTDIRITGYKPFTCSEDDLSSTGFVATNVKGKRISGVVCGGGLKGYTIRFD